MNRAANLGQHQLRKLRSNRELICGAAHVRCFSQLTKNHILEGFKFQDGSPSPQRKFKKIKHNFNAGPSRLPPAVMEMAEKDFIDYKGMGISVIEMSHRQKEFTQITKNLLDNFRKVMKVPDNFRVLLEQGGATQQFTSVPLNLAGHVFGQQNESANFLVSGYWSQKAAKEAGKYHKVQQVNNCDDLDDLKKLQETVLDYENWQLNKDGKYFFFCQNESISGLELDQALMRSMIDRVKKEIPNQIFVADMSSSIGSRDLTKFDLWQDFGVVYAGAQKNFGTSGLTFVCVRDDVMSRVKLIKERTKIPIPALMDWYQSAQQTDYFINTPSLFSIYISHLMCKHMLEMGGISYYEQLAETKAKKMYSFFDETLAEVQDGHSKYGEMTDMHRVYFANDIDQRLRSRMNVSFNLASLDTSISEHQEQSLLQALDYEGFCGLKGHRSMGGFRASIYNSIEYEHVVALCHLLKEQQEVHQKPTYQSAMI